MQSFCATLVLHALPISSNISIVMLMLDLKLTQQINVLNSGGPIIHVSVASTLMMETKNVYETSFLNSEFT
jgi:hypothetical protein